MVLRLFNVKSINNTTRTNFCIKSIASLVIRLHLGFVFLNKGILELGRFMVYV